MTVSKSVRRFLTEYEEALGRLDFEKVDEFFTDTFISADPIGTVAQANLSNLSFDSKQLRD
jgi:hypothetical protein